MAEPGANRSTHEPILEKFETVSNLVEDPTVIAVGSRDGEKLQAFCESFPAATATTMPSTVALFTALSNAWLLAPPRLRFMTAGSPAT